MPPLFEDFTTEVESVANGGPGIFLDMMTTLALHLVRLRSENAEDRATEQKEDR